MKPDPQALGAGPQAPSLPWVQARVGFASGREIALEWGGDLVKARLAFSCLVQPREGDLVLCLPGEDGECHVAAILERPGSQAMTLAFPGDASLRTEEGALTLSGRSLTLAAEDRLFCTSDVALHQSREAVLDHGRIIAHGQSVQAHFDSFTLLGRMCQTLVQHLVQKVQTYIRRTEDLDQVQAAQMIRRSEGLYTLHSEYSVLVSTKDTKIDGERIHMG